MRLLLPILIILTACGGQPEPPAASITQVRDGRVTIRMADDMRFSPMELTVSVGDTITWINDGDLPHTSSDQPGLAAVNIHNVLPGGAAPWNSGLLDHGDSITVVFDTPGEYTYLCLIHETNGMIGTISVGR